ncbi:YceI family protein [Algoriphagus sp. D3-2-R+10]|uniref:YceI family protein n=1 Tax=Algoriphagus aurantiacus TaxID=3103948 RepID=UPI002B3A3F0D|nr:YceI family protein [Algoriphagus sp. D3-2-R+10]MEB2777586.1 YceI family protein [Algoriphagus sp. D3-2-R+10]
MKIIKQTGFILAAALMTFACGKSTDTVEATAAQEVAEAEGTTLTVDTGASTITWTGYKPAGQHNGVIPATEGTLITEGETIAGGKITFDITQLEIKDLEAGSEDYGKLHGHLQSADFFDAATHPTATFEITAVEPFTSSDSVSDKDEFETEFTPSSDSELAPEAPTNWISGNLTMRGTTKNIKFPATVSVSNGTAAVKAGFNIDRTDWGLAYGDEATATDKTKDKFIYNSVSIVLDTKAN